MTIADGALGSAGLLIDPTGDSVPVLIQPDGALYVIWPDQVRMAVGAAQVDRLLGEGWRLAGNLTVAARLDVGPTCEAFALCGNIATRQDEHPILGFYPSCDRCHAKLFPADGGVSNG